METINLIVLGLAGILLHYLSRWKELADKKQNLNLSSEIPGILISIITTIVLILTRDDYKTYFQVTSIGAAVLGYCSQSVWTKLVTMKLGSVMPGEGTVPAPTTADGNTGNQDHPKDPPPPANP